MMPQSVAGYGLPQENAYGAGYGLPAESSLESLLRPRQSSPEAVHNRTVKRLEDTLGISVRRAQLVPSYDLEGLAEIHYSRDKSVIVAQRGLFDFNEDHLNLYGGRFASQYNAMRAIHLEEGAPYSIEHVLEDTLVHEYAHQIFNDTYMSIVLPALAAHRGYSPEQAEELAAEPGKDGIFHGASEAFAFWLTDVMSGHGHLNMPTTEGYARQDPETPATIRHFYDVFHRAALEHGVQYVLENAGEIMAEHLVEAAAEPA